MNSATPNLVRHCSYLAKFEVWREIWSSVGGEKLQIWRLKFSVGDGLREILSAQNEYYPKPLPQKALLRRPEGKFWTVRWAMSQEGVISFQDGWYKFVKDNGLIDGDAVIFTYDGSRGFWVRIYRSGLLVKATDPVNIQEISDDETCGCGDNDDQQHIVPDPDYLYYLRNFDERQMRSSLAPEETDKTLTRAETVAMPDKENSKDQSKKRKREQKHNSDLNETGDTCNGSEAETNDSTNTICLDDVDDQPLSAWINISTEVSSERSPKVVKNSAAVVVEETQAKGTLTTLPFTKMLPFWKTYETEEVYKTVPQNPHFSQLVEVKEDIREWSAVGMMVSFFGLLKEVKDLKLDVSSKKLSSLGSSFAELEKHGFDVSTPQSWINKVLSLQDGRANKAEEKKCLEKKIEVEEIERQKLETEMVDLERKILELKKRQDAVVKEKKEAADKMIVEMKSRAETIDQEIEDMELEFAFGPPF